MLILSFSAPHGTELDLPSTRGAIGLFATPIAGFRSPHRDPRTIHPEVQRLRERASVFFLRLFRLVPFDFSPQGFSGSLDTLGWYGDSSELSEQLATFFEAHRGADERDHSKHSWRKGGVFKPEITISGAKPFVAIGTVVVRSNDSKLTQYRPEDLLPTTYVACPLPAGAEDRSALVVRLVSVEEPLDHTCCDRQRQSSRLVLNRLESSINLPGSNTDQLSDSLLDFADE